MPQIRVYIIDAPNQKKIEARLPDDAPVNELVMALVSKLGLPPIDRQGQPVSYRLDNRESGERLTEQQTLADAGVSDGALLILTPELVAGGQV